MTFRTPQVAARVAARRAVAQRSGGSSATGPVGGRRQSGEDVAEVSQRIDPAAAAAFDDGVKDGTAFARFGLAKEQPVLFPQRGGTDRILAACLAHIRREIHEAKDQAPQITGFLLKHIQNLYRIESRLRQRRAGPALRQAVREAESRPIFLRLQKTLLTLKARYLPKCALGKAIAYALAQWPRLELWLRHGQIQIDSNLVENAIRPTALGKKNWLFFGDARTGQRSAVIYTINCRLHGIDPSTYLRDVLTRLPGMPNHQIAELTPQAWAKARMHKARLPAAA